MVKLRSISRLIIGIFLFSLIFQANNFGQTQIDVQNSLDSSQHKPLSLGEPLEEGFSSNEIKNSSLNSLGEIEIAQFYFSDASKNPSSDNFFPTSSNIINHTHHNPNFLGTIENASAERAIERDDPRSTNIKIQISESVIWKYNESATKYIVGFTPVLQKAFIDKMYFNGTELDPSEYIENSTGEGSNKVYSFYYDFEETFDAYHKGEFNLTYVYNMIFPIKEWSVTNIEPNQYISETNQTFTQQFSYNVTLGDESSRIHCQARLKFYLPNYQDIFEPVLNNYDNNTILPSQYDLTDNILTFTSASYLNETVTMDLTFKANFTVELIETVDGLWCEDRLVAGLNIRERDYKITITEGPADLILKNIGINETGIYFNQLYNGGESGRSALDRSLYIENMNNSSGNEDVDINETITKTYVDGISFLHSVDMDIVELESYWLAKNEIDIITIKYIAIYNLSIIIMDKISTPLEGYSVKIFIGNQLYGTMINNFTTMPYPMMSSDNNGEILFHSVPIANYTIEIYNRNGKYLENATVTPLEEKNYIVTSIPHYPVTILMFTGVSAAFIVIGYIIFKKNS